VNCCEVAKENFGLEEVIVTTAPPATKSTAMTDSEVSKIVAKGICVAHTTRHCTSKRQVAASQCLCSFLLLIYRVINNTISTKSRIYQY